MRSPFLPSPATAIVRPACVGLIWMALLATGPSTLFAATAPADALLTADEVHKLVDAGQYKDALRGIGRIMQLSGPAAAPYNRHDILMLRAECQLQIHATSSALDTLTLARKEALAANKPNDFLDAEGFAQLIQKSPRGEYTPMTADIKTPINILDRAARKSAYEALFADEVAVFQRKAAAADAGRSLPPFLEAAKLAGGIRAVEFAATGSNKQTDVAVKDLAQHALKLINTVISDCSTRADRINSSANRTITDTVMVTGPGGQSYPVTQTRRQGLTGNDAKDLKDIRETCIKLTPATAEFAKAFTAQGEDFHAAGVKSDDVRKKAESTLTANYAGVQ